MPAIDNWLADLVYVVTGGTQGIGAAVALEIARAGARGVVICGRNSARGEEVKAAIEAEKCEVEFVRADLELVDDCRSIMAACDTRFGRIDGLP